MTTREQLASLLRDLSGSLSLAPGAYAQGSSERHVQATIHGTVMDGSRSYGLLQEAARYLDEGGSVEQASLCLFWAEVWVSRLTNRLERGESRPETPAVMIRRALGASRGLPGPVADHDEPVPDAVERVRRAWETRGWTPPTFQAPSTQRATRDTVKAVGADVEAWIHQRHKLGLNATPRTILDEPEWKRWLADRKRAEQENPRGGTRG